MAYYPERPVEDRPCAAEGLLSYRYRGNYGWIMIGAVDDADALRSAARSLSSGTPTIDQLERWDTERYVPAAPGRTMANADSFRAAAKALRAEAAKPRNRKYAHAHNLMADSLEQQAAALDTPRQA